MKSRQQISPAKAGAMALKQHACERRASLNIRDNLEPVFRFNDGVFIWRLTPELREVLGVDDDNPGVVVIIE